MPVEPGPFQKVKPVEGQGEERDESIRRVCACVRACAHACVPAWILLIAPVSFMLDHLVMSDGHWRAHYLHPRQTHSETDRNTGRINMLI
jgi:hypothetical protein